MTHNHNLTCNDPFSEDWQQMTMDVCVAWMEARSMHTMGMERDWAAERAYFETGLPLNRHVHSYVRGYDCGDGEHTMGRLPSAAPSDRVTVGDEYTSGPVPVTKPPVAVDP